MAGLPGIKGDDGAVPWCAIFVGAMLNEALVEPSRSAMARSYSKWGRDCPIGTPGAVTVISSDRGPATGHVFFATGRLTPTHIEGLGGNQNDAVTIAWWPRSRIAASRWPTGLWPPAGKPELIAATVPAGGVRDA